MTTLIGIAGYDPLLVKRLSRPAQRFFAWVSALSIVASIIVGLGMADGALLAFSSVIAPLLGVVFVLLTLNLYRLLHAGTGYPMHLAIEDIDDWRPGSAPALVLLALGFLVTQPLVFLAMKPLLHAQLSAGDGLITRAHAAWNRPELAGPLTAAFAVLVSMPAWLRILFPTSIRAYERERWIEGRILVDDAFADAQGAITRLLDRVPGFSGTLAVHYADPPYNMKPLVFGLDPDVVERGQIKWVPYKEPPPQKVVVAEAPVPTAPTTPTAPAPAPAPTAPTNTSDGEELIASWDDTSKDEETGVPDLAFFDIGRLQVKRAREHIDVTAPFIAAFTGRPEAEVRGFLRTAPPEERVHRLFGDYKKLRSILLKDASFALNHGLAPIVAIIVQRPLVDVEKRLRAAPADKRLTGVFAPELARRLLKNKNAPR